ncbi:uncharacterized protein LOC111718172, partial [Eurytemora carolleeae]|uniref:uncharacterized protein LOC111718172 n=1 Tax=Eurytemora carolleeae TaxID=1294199 RepID=UPI000C7796B9
MKLLLLLLLLLFGLCLGEECCGPGISTDCVPCIPLCCPTGEVRMTDTKWTPHRCHLDEPPAKACAEPTLENLPDFTNYYHQGKMFGLLPSKDKFVCPDPEQGLIPADLFYYNISLLETGELVGIHPLEVGVKIINHSNSQFCLVYAQFESTENETEELSVGFMICTQDSQPVDQGSKEFTMIFYPCALIISSMFLLFTIISYILDPDLHRPLFGKITLGFIINLLLTYICLTTGYISRYTGLTIKRDNSETADRGVKGEGANKTQFLLVQRVPYHIRLFL